MRYKDKGRKVKIAQKCLRAAGSSVEINGEFTLGMMSAVMSYQKKHGLEKTGVIDDLTWDVLKRELPFWKRLF